MKLLGVLWSIMALGFCSEYDAEGHIDSASRQILDFKLQHEKPIGLLTHSWGEPVDVRDTSVLNTDQTSNQFWLDQILSIDSERIAERVVHAKGTGAFGYFELNKDLSNYTKADLFNGAGKKTPIATRFSLVQQNTGGSDLERENRGFAIKFYTNEGNFDLLLLHTPYYFYRDPVDFFPFVHSTKRNPQTNQVDLNMRYDFITLRPHSLVGFMYLFSDYGIPKNYRRMDGFSIHAFELYNKHGERFYCRFNFRTDQGLANYTSEEARRIKGEDKDFHNRDLYNAIAKGNYPSWTLDLYIIAENDLKKIDFDPFDMTRLWPEGHYKTIYNVGRVVLNRNPKNYFAEVEQAAYNPMHLVPGIGAPPDAIFQGRRVSYLDTVRSRIGSNPDKIEVNYPKYYKLYNRDGSPPVRDNMLDAPVYYPNSFHGPMPMVDEARPKEHLHILESTAVDLEPAADFYNNILRSEGEKQRLADTIGESLVNVIKEIRTKALWLYGLVSEDLAKRVSIAYELALAQAKAREAKEAAIEEADRLERLKNHLGDHAAYDHHHKYPIPDLEDKE